MPGVFTEGHCYPMGSKPGQRCPYRLGRGFGSGFGRGATWTSPLRLKGNGVASKYYTFASSQTCRSIGFHPIEIKAVLPHAAKSMKDPVYKLIELTGTSTTSMEEAVGVAIKRAGKTVKNLRWFQVIETRGTIEKGHVLLWQVTLKVGFAVEG